MLPTFINYFLAFLFISSACLKLKSVGSFRNHLVAFDFLPLPLLTPLSFAIPLCELLLGAAMLVRPVCPQEMILATSILLVFTVFIGWALKARKNTSCFCFGESDGTISRITLIRNISLLLISSIATVWSFLGIGEMPAVLKYLLIGYAVVGLLLFLSVVQLANLSNNGKRVSE